jgi:hypothetical protein
LCLDDDATVASTMMMRARGIASAREEENGDEEKLREKAVFS